MFSSFSTALSALNADSTAIDVVGNNLANLNTTGFKTSDVSFQDLVAQSLSGGHYGKAGVMLRAAAATGFWRRRGRPGADP